MSIRNTVIRLFAAVVMLALIGTSVFFIQLYESWAKHFPMVAKLKEPKLQTTWNDYFRLGIDLLPLQHNSYSTEAFLISSRPVLSNFTRNSTYNSHTINTYPVQNMSNSSPISAISHITADKNMMQDTLSTHTHQSFDITSQDISEIIHHPSQLSEHAATKNTLISNPNLSLGQNNDHKPTMQINNIPNDHRDEPPIFQSENHSANQSDQTKIHRSLSIQDSTAQHNIQTPPPSQQGYVLAVSYYEQQTMGLRNMFQLQCWAQSLKLLVVKPVLHDSFLRTPLDLRQQGSFLQFNDCFNISQWNHQTQRLNYAPLVEWEDFLTRAPKSVVLVQFEYPSVSLLKSRKKSGEELLHNPVFQRYTSGCSGKWPSASELNFLKSKGFQILRKVCFNFFYGDQLTLAAFNDHILNGLSPNTVTVVMDMWRGISTAQRVLLKDTCLQTNLIQEHIALSAQLKYQVDQYIHKYLGRQPYLAIMGRLEITQLTIHKKAPVVPFCLEETISQWTHYKKLTQLNQTFLSIDIGRYGSKKYRSSLEPELKMAFEKFFQKLFGMSSSIREWEKRFELIAGNKDAGYIGLLQKAIVTRAKCILFVGGGAFQRHALYLYKQMHPAPQHQCYSIVQRCTHSGKLA